jgi:SAM-dependent methyltransferase
MWAAGRACSPGSSLTAFPTWWASTRTPRASSWPAGKCLDGQVEFVCGDFLTHPFPPASFGLITCVAALHHMDAADALARMSQLLAPGGSLVIVGLARSRPPDLLWDAAAVIANLGHRVASPAYLPPDPRPRGDAAGRQIPAAPVVAVLPGLGQVSVIGPAGAAWPWPVM